MSPRARQLRACEDLRWPLMGSPTNGELAAFPTLPICEVESSPTRHARDRRYVAVYDVGRAINPLIVDAISTRDGRAGAVVYEQCFTIPHRPAPVGLVQEYASRGRTVSVLHTRVEIPSPTQPPACAPRRRRHTPASACHQRRRRRLAAYGVAHRIPAPPYASGAAPRKVSQAAAAPPQRSLEGSQCPHHEGIDVHATAFRRGSWNRRKSPWPASRSKWRRAAPADLPGAAARCARSRAS